MHVTPVRNSVGVILDVVVRQHHVLGIWTSEDQVLCPRIMFGLARGGVVVVGSSSSYNETNCSNRLMC